MKCPCCQEEMELGVIQSNYEINWKPGRKKRLLGNAEFHEGAVVLSKRSFLTGSAVEAHLCRACGKIVIDLNDDRADLNEH